MGNAHSSMSTAPRGSDSHSVWNSALAACVEEANREHLTSLLAQAAASATDPQFQPSLAGVLGPLLRDRAPALPPPQVLVDSTLGSEPDCSLQQEEFEKKGVRPFVSSDSPKRKTKASRNPSPPAESTLGLLGTTNVSHGFSNKQRKSVIDGASVLASLSQNSLSAPLSSYSFSSSSSSSPSSTTIVSGREKRDVSAPTSRWSSSITNTLCAPSDQALLSSPSGSTRNSVRTCLWELLFSPPSSLPLPLFLGPFLPAV